VSDGDSIPEDLMRYDVLAQHALRSVVKLALQRVVRDGLPGEHHFFISFDTNYQEQLFQNASRRNIPTT